MFLTGLCLSRGLPLELSLGIYLAAMESASYHLSTHSKQDTQY